MDQLGLKRGGRTEDALASLLTAVPFRQNKREKLSSGKSPNAATLVDVSPAGAHNREASHHSAGPSGRSQDDVHALRKQHRIYVKGTDIQPPLVEFSDVCKKRKFYKKLLANVEECGFLEPTPIQRQAIPLMLKRREVLCVAPTGSGKTLAYLLPIVIQAKLGALKGREGVKALLVGPTRELAAQIARVLARLVQGLGLRCCLLSAAGVTAGTDFTKMDIVVATPLRLSKAAKKAGFSSVEFLVFDEADKLLDQGFVAQMDKVVAACTNPRRVAAFFSATLPEKVEELARSLLKQPVRVTVGERNSAAASVQQRLVFVGNEAGKLIALRDLLASGTRPPILVFTNSKQRCDALHRDLALEGVLVDSISADQAPGARSAVVDRFREGRIHLLVCTDLMARGIDFLNVQTVINYDFPLSAVDYVHRVGRTGRAGRSGQAITFFEERDAGQLRRIANLMHSSGMEVPAWMLQLRKEKTVLKQRLKDRKDSKPHPKQNGSLRAKRKRVAE
ncbi:g7410 [Coccomyxa elongata]